MDSANLDGMGEFVGERCMIELGQVGVVVSHLEVSVGVAACDNRSPASCIVDTRYAMKIAIT